jgi:hypothetical protein
MSASNVHSARSPLQRAIKQASIASAVERAGRNPYELGSAVVSATGSSESRGEGLHRSLLHASHPQGALATIALGDGDAP